tara:strand:+ start:64 stop:504 length:441 start_codon:yes stop_codon:yes gene_type:complete
MLDVLMVTMSLIATFAMMFLAYFLYEYHIKITELESQIAKFKQICATLNTKKDTLENSLRTGRAGYQELWNKYDESEKNCKIISDMHIEANDQTIHYMKMVDELVLSIDRLVDSYPSVFSTKSFGNLYAELKERGTLIKEPVLTEE